MVALRSGDGVAGLILEHLLWVFVETKRQEHIVGFQSTQRVQESRNTVASRYGKKGKRTLPTLPEETILAACS